jgi:hypothetical protein
MSDFDWSRDRESVVISEQRMTAVYSNGDGDLVVRQACWPEDDVWIVVARSNVQALAAAMLQEAGTEPLAPAVPLLPKPSSSAAERSRRYRERRASHEDRDADRDAGSEELPFSAAAE